MKTREEKKEYQRKYYLKNKEEQKEYKKKYYADNKEESKERGKKYDAEHREEKNEKARKYYLKNKERIKERGKKYYAENKDERREEKKERSKKYRAEHKEETKEYQKEYQAEHREEQKEYKKKYHVEHKKEINEHQTNRKKTDINFKLSSNLRTRLYFAIKNKQKLGSAVGDLGCSIEYLKSYLEQQFKEGMTWENWSKNGWHIDHQIPLSIVDLTDRDSLLHVCHYTNLQAMWAENNYSKGNRVIR